MLFAVIIIFCKSSIVLQVALADILSTVLLAFYLRVRPMVGIVSNFIEVVNESFALTAFWLLFLFTDYIEDPLQRYKYGFFFIYTVAALICVNFTAFAYSLVSKIYAQVRSYLIRRKILTRIKQIQALRQENMRLKRLHPDLFKKTIEELTAEWRRKNKRFPLKHYESSSLI